MTILIEGTYVPIQHYKVAYELDGTAQEVLSSGQKVVDFFGNQRIMRIFAKRLH